MRLIHVGVLAGFWAIASAIFQPVAAQTLSDSLASAYSNNPELNAARSRLRSIDENIALARSGNRPLVEGIFRQNSSTTRTESSGGFSQTSGTNSTAIQVRLTQPLFQGFQVRNRVRGAEAAVQAQRASLVNTEQDVLLNAVTAFEDVVQNRAIVDLRKSDIRFLEEQVRAAEDRFEVGEGTRTDVSQAEARLANAQSRLAFAEANRESAEATFREVTGLDAANLVADIPVEDRVPGSLNEAVNAGQDEHPAIRAALLDVDVANFNVKELEGQFMPTVSVVGEAGTTFNPRGGIDRQDSASIGLEASVPIYQQGRVSAQVRQAKEDLGTSRIQVDRTRNQVRQNAVASWAAYRASVRAIFAARTGVFASQLALEGVIEERRVGQRTTLDVLDQQRELIASQVTLVQAERDKAVAAFRLLASVGRLNAGRLGLQVALYQPREHTEAVRDKWFGLRTPDGR